MIEQDEGYSPGLYKDTLGQWTIGIGFCLDRRPMPRLVALYWLDMIIDEIREDLLTTDQYPIFQFLNDARKSAIINMCYQMGVTGVCHPVDGFVKMWKALENQDYESAADHALNSRWAKIQTPNRAKRVCHVIRIGAMDDYIFPLVVENPEESQ